MRSEYHHRAGAIFVASLFVLGLLTIIPSASATTGVPFCGPASVGAGSEPTADVAYDPSVCEAITGRVFPEAFAQDVYFQADASGHSNTGVATDYVGYFEFQQGLAYLEENYPDYIETHIVADSYGLCPVQATPDPDSVGPGQFPSTDCPVPLDRNPVYMIEITNENSPMPLEERQALLFMLSIHGVEKGGREGGMRVMEDLLKGIGFASETVQDGAGMPTPLEKPTGGNVENYKDMLDFTRLFLLFPNTDGWVHDEAPYAGNNPSCGAPPNGVLFCRTNGNGVDLNRQGPTLGWHNPGRNPVGEPESVGYYNWMLENDIEWTYAIDIHGMLNHRNFGAIMLPAGSMTPQEMERSLGLAETLKQRLNNDPHFDEWQSLMTTGEQTEGPNSEACQQADCPGPTSNLWGAGELGSSDFAEYYTVIDAIGYTDSGFNGDFFAQNTGLNAPGYDIELAYNHITSDSNYNGASALWNDYHVKMVREIVKSYMDAAALDISVSLDTGGSRTLVLQNPNVITNLDDQDADGNPTPNLPADSWAAQNDGDDLWDYSEETPFTARPHKYWEDIKPYVTDGDVPGVLNFQSGTSFNAADLEDYDTLVIPGTAINAFIGGIHEPNTLGFVELPDGETQMGAVDQANVDAVLEWVENGGTLVLTDSALKFLDLAGLTEDAVDVVPRYMGGIKVADYLDHELLKNVRGGVMQMYEPTPIGFGTSGSSPNWFVDEAAWTGIGGEIAGRECGETSLNTPACDDRGIGLGQVAQGEGTIRIMGSLLPDPTEEFYHPYGLDHYATTYSGNAIMLNLLGWEKEYRAPAVAIQDGKIIETPNEPQSDGTDGLGDGTDGEDKDTPSVGTLLLMAVLALAAVVARRRS